jgi:NADH-quinone oxidoreductase subunit E
VPRPGPQDGRFASEPKGGLTSLTGVERVCEANASVTLAERLGDTLKRITGDEPTPRTALAGAQKRPRIDAAEASDRGPAVAEQRPAGLAAPLGAGADDLKLIKGVGPELEALLHRLGFFHFSQIAAWTPAEVAWVDSNLEGFHGRVTRDGWVEQARQLAEEGDTPHAHEKVERDTTE